MTRLIFILLIFLTTTVFLHGQSENKLTGSVRDSLSNEPMEAVSVYVKETGTGTYTRSNGQFSIDLKKKFPLTLRFSYVGYTNKTITLHHNDSLGTVHVLLSPKNEKLSEIVVRSNSLQEKFNSAYTSTESLEARDAEVLPALFGEIDIIKTLQLKPGISSGTEGSSNLFVRGGSGDQNLVLFDGVNIYNPSHLFGFFSTFNNDALSSVDVFKGGFPAAYGGRLSSVIDVQSKTPDSGKLNGSGGIGLISSRLTLEGPVIKDKVSFLVSGRRTYADLFTEMVNQFRDGKPDITPIPRYRFYDLNAKLSFQISDRDEITLSGYQGADIFGFTNDLFKFDFEWGNRAVSLQWTHGFSDRIYMNAALFGTNYKYSILNQAGEFDFNLGSDISDRGIRWNLFIDHLAGHYLHAGAQWINHKFNVGRFKAGSTTDNIAFSAGSSPKGNEFAAFVSDQFALLDHIKLNLGFRYSGFTGTDNFYHNLEPRFGINVSLNERINLKSSYARMNQYVHLIANNGISLPTDIWYPTTEQIKPQKSDQFVIGLNYLLSSSYLLTHEYYYKTFQNQIELKNHAQIFANANLEQEFTFGDGYAYGTEVGIEKQVGDWRGWLGYTLAWVRRGNFADIEGGDYFSPQFDRRHDFSAVSTYKLNNKWTISGTFVYGSGDKAWLPGGRFSLQDIDSYNSFPMVPLYGKRNTITIPGYHRLDVSVIRSWESSWGKHNLNISFYNLYNRRNPYFLYLDSELKSLLEGTNDLEVPIKVTARQVSLFPLIPSLSWNFKF
ncbi:TonB-dependent receptor [Membranicola marinus]|uniref:TonB-dependent receptor n=1 Tax=Membranihabitans marinus TaxID=1227546 RepID=A0A953HR43_9BACT|nr:TonB-dependent receptor [Membranihabitans marinus]MBY5959363.1 TonB-dependent receptor [Membranihabitans marinus]